MLPVLLLPLTLLAVLPVLLIPVCRVVVPLAEQTPAFSGCMSKHSSIDAGRESDCSANESHDDSDGEYSNGGNCGNGGNGGNGDERHEDDGSADWARERVALR
jgi:hypothetical protein